MSKVPPIQLGARGAILPGHGACHGCPIMMGMKTMISALGEKLVIVVPASCSSVIVGLYPKTSVNRCFIHTAFACAASVASGISKALKMRGLTDTKVVVWAGDGGTADIGMATLSGAAERNEDIIYIMYDNEAYMNTGIQRSSSTPPGAWTTTTPTGKREFKKDVARIMIAHGVPYVATASVGYLQDFYNKVKKAASIRGFKFIQLHAPCPTGWRFDPKDTVRIARLAVETGMWILYEYQDGKLTLSPPSKPYLDKSRRKPIKEYIEAQGRFKGVSEEFIRVLEEQVDRAWEWVKASL